MLVYIGNGVQIICLVLDIHTFIVLQQSEESEGESPNSGRTASPGKLTTPMLRNAFALSIFGRSSNGASLHEDGNGRVSRESNDQLKELDEAQPLVMEQR